VAYAKFRMPNFRCFFFEIAKIVFCLYIFIVDIMFKYHVRIMMNLHRISEISIDNNNIIHVDYILY